MLVPTEIPVSGDSEANDDASNAERRPSHVIKQLRESLRILAEETPQPSDDGGREEALGAADAAIDEALGRLPGGGSTDREMLIARCREVAALSDLKRDLEAEDRADVEGEGVREALAGLRGIQSLPRLIPKALAELCRSCGFDRAIFSRVHDNYFVAEAVHFEGDLEFAEQIRTTWRRNPPQLTHLLLETELVRRRAPALVTDAVGDPRTFKPLVEAIGTSSYVVAPLLPSGRVVGFLHADRGLAGDAVDQADCDALALFAEGLGYAAERTVLLERLRFQRKHLRRQMMASDALAAELTSEQIELIEVGAMPELDVDLLAEATGGAAPHRLEKILTNRELDVLALMASGATNVQIADRLVLAEGTVKTHVKHILRKLRASNRAEAVARYMRLSAEASR